MADQEWRGHWWLPGKPDAAVPGILVQREDDGEVLLRLVGGFNIDVWTPAGENAFAGSYDTEFPIVLGDSAGQQFTLLQCVAIHTSGAFGSRPIYEQDVRVMRALRGIHLRDPDEEVFESAVLRIEYLLGWMHASTIKAAVELQDYGWTGKQTAQTVPAEDLTATYGDSDFTLRVAFNRFRVENRPRANERAIANREWAELAVTAAHPAKFRQFDRIAKAVMDLMTLVAHAPAGVIEETLRFTPSDDHPVPGRRASADVHVMGRQIHQARPGQRETADPEYLFTLADIPFAEVLPRWLDLHERTWLGCSTLFGLRYIQEGYTTSRLLTVATAAEAMHRGLFPGATHMPPKKFGAMRTRVMDAFQGKDAEAKDTRAFLSDYLHNDMRYKDRLLALAEIPDQDAVATLISNVPKWAKYLKDRRNGLAHGDEGRIGPDDGAPIYGALEVTIALLGLVLLNELGLSAEVQRRAASSQYMHLIIEGFNKALS
ncbi:MAG TPA: HEPN domain-containing protein [Streptosporangiaceae bacterium]|jgi:hypothetical protein